ncbi:NAD(P)/FAD-dependent oxidoreductase [Aidingimonas lacisalsi]|uniref:NAD(P)/FAD-dependent oxidoreductase n=1 Tax=Aidingimonas lacisalsi TaxID=2604086 RepID=UPI0013759292|nr:FAD-dependent oxidoreductase [Aidingimonas lacisalsi]
MRHDHTQQVTVVGAGVVGLCMALRLQRLGRQVLLVDRQPAGTGTSSGNAGYIAIETIDPLSTMSSLRSVPRQLLDRHGALKLPMRYLPTAAPWLMRFAAAARPDQAERGRQALVSLNSQAVDAWRRCLTDIGAAGALSNAGHLLVWESSSAAQPRRLIERLARHDIRAEWQSSAEVRERIPALSARVKQGVWFPQPAKVADPAMLCRRLFDAFMARGGRWSQQAIRHVESDGERAILHGETERIVTNQLVIAAGAYSHRLCADLGLDVPLETERGYHLTLPGACGLLPHSMESAERHCVLSPLRSGLRIVGISEIGGLKLQPRQQRFAILKRHLQALIDGPDGFADAPRTWMGFRPTLPDSLPVLDRHPRLANVFLAFGHQHLGLTQAAVSAEWLAESVVYGKHGERLSPFRVTRFERRCRHLSAPSNPVRAG